MKDSFIELERIWNRCVEDAQKNMETEILDLLNDQGIRTRQDDGVLRQITLSKPTSVNSAFAIGLRYVKRDGTQTEDLFRVERGQPIVGCYKGSLEEKWPEYRGTHKQQITFAIAADEPSPTTAVNTISMLKSHK